jgi:hypothetical protein
LNAIWRWPYVQNCSQLRYFSRGTGTVCFQTVRREGSPERNAQQPGAVGLDVGYSQRIELVDGDGSSRFEKLAVDFDESRISWLALCIMIIRLANQKPQSVIAVGIM